MFIADFHIHSHYSRATSRDCVPGALDMWARRKGLHLIGTGDFTHAAWRGELREALDADGTGFYTLKRTHRRDAGVAGDAPPRFIVTGEISCIYKKDGRVRKVHNLILLPSLEAADALAARLEAVGNLHSDGRPILGLDSRDLLDITLSVCPDAIFIPAHIWTPHFSLFGAYSGFDRIEECFGDLTGHIHALETGLSSDPSMIRRLSALDGYALVSNSDAHSPKNLAREANLFETAMSYDAVSRALDGRDAAGLAGTIEFFPEEGKYHFDGHRSCKLCQKPSLTKSTGGLCPVCGKRLTVGVLSRVEDLADREEGFVPPGGRRYESLVPLPEVIAASTGFSPASQKGQALYAALLAALGPELPLLREVPVADIEAAAGPPLAEGVRRLREGRLDIRPGYDGEYGKVTIMDKSEIALLSGQQRLFAGSDPKPPAPESPAVVSAASKPVRREPAPAPAGPNPGQRAAATSDAPVVAVIAGPGTGKTKTLVDRAAWLLAGGAPPASVTAVTFTNKAAGELKARLAALPDGARVQVGTFHSLCLRLLGGDVAVVDPESAQGLMADILRERGSKEPPGDALAAVSLLKNGAADADGPAGELREAYDARLAAMGAMDFDDLLLRVLERLEGAGEPFDRTPFTHLLVDEFQDVNPVQYRLIGALSPPDGTLFVIGDPDQSIYGFRGSQQACFSWLDRDRPEAATFSLTRNYRSAPAILRAAAPVVRARPLEAVQPEDLPVALAEADDPYTEARFVTGEIARLVGGVDMNSGADAGGTIGFSDIAVLYRTRRQADRLEPCLKAEGIPYTVAGRDDYLTDPAVRGCLAFFRLMLRPGDALSLEACLRHAAGVDPRRAREAAAVHREAGGTWESLAALLAETAPELASPADHCRQAVKKQKPQRLIADWIADRGLTGSRPLELLLHTALPHADMAAFTRALALGQEGDLVRAGGRVARDAVSLMTLHASKGLEFPVVFLCGVSDGLIPYRGRGRCDEEEEERRLLYVGMTRARQRLFVVTGPDRSPFLSGLPSDCVRELDTYSYRAPPKQLDFFGL